MSFRDIAEALNAMPEEEAERARLALYMRRIETEMREEEEKVVETGMSPVVVRKLYGPTVFVDLRITPDIERTEWVIERATGPDATFVEWVRIPGQMDLDFTDWSEVDPRYEE